MKLLRLIYILCFSLSLFSSCSLQKSSETKPLLEKAEQHRQRAIQATKRGPQLQEVGAALELYLQLERTLRKAGTSPSSALYEAIGNAYALLQQPGWALFYYHQALVKVPRDPELRERITETERQAGLVPSSFTTSWLGYQELLNMTGLLFLLAFICGSFSIWLESKWLQQKAILCGLIGTLPLLIALYVAHATALYGIVIESTPLYRTPASSLVAEGQSSHTRIVLAGTQVEVLRAASDPAWLIIRFKEETSSQRKNETLFYVPSQSIRLIELKL